MRSKIHVEISNKIRSVFDRPKAKQLKAVHKSSSVIVHWLHKTILEERSLQNARGSFKIMKV
jgi:hypothetical protein